MKPMKKSLSLILALALVCCAVPFAAMAETVVDRDGPTITLDVYSQLANFSGIQQGWGAVMLKDKFNVELNIIPDQDGTYETRVASGNLGDIVVWGANGQDYKNAVEKGLLLDWEEDNLAETYAPYIWENYQGALNANRAVSGDDTIHGFGHAVAFKQGSHAAFFYTWDLRWDLYKQLGYPEINNLDDLYDVLAKMKELEPTDERGNPTYATSIWPDWDGNMVMYVKSLGTAYYGYDELGFGYYNPNNGQFVSCLDEDGPYLKCLQFFNRLYQAGLLDPNSMTQTYDVMGEKVKNGGTFWGIFNYSTSLIYNTTSHLEQGKMMYSLVPKEASPIVYGLGTNGGNRVWTIGNYTEYPELCLEILNWLATPEGSMCMWYGPKGVTWDYDENGLAYFTELGKLTSSDSSQSMDGVQWTSPWTGKTYTFTGTFNDGCVQINNVTLAQDMENPDGANGETFNKNSWESEVTASSYPIQEDWRQWSGFASADQYMNNGRYTVMPEINYSESPRSSQLDLIWQQCATTVKQCSWKAIYAKSDAEFNAAVSEMKARVNMYGWKQCVEWCEQECAAKWALSQEAAVQ